MTDSGKPTASPRQLSSPSSAAATPDLRELLNSPAFLHDLLTAGLAQACEVSSCEIAGLYLLDDEAERPRLKLFAQRGLDHGHQQSFATLAQAQDLAMQAAVASETVVQRDGTILSASGEPGKVTCAAVPLMVSDWTLGALLVMSREPVELPPASLATLLTLSAHLASTIAAQATAQQIREERDCYERIAANVRDCIWTCYLDPFRLTLITDGIFAFSGYTRQEIMQRPALLYELLHPDDRPMLEQQRAEVLAGELTEIHHRVRLIHKNGEIRWIHTRGRAVRDESGWRMDAITTDITAHVRLEEKVRRADRLSAVSILAGGIAHEYNNLHFAILGTLDLMLMRDDLDEAARAHVNRVREAAERASDITHKLVSFARSGSGGREVMDVSELIEATLGMVKREFSTRGIDVDIKQSPLPLRVQGNRAELGQVLINLVLNAQQAMEGSLNKHLTIDTGVREGKVFVSITDTGHGISPENLPRLFDPFFTTKGAAGSWAQDRSAADARLPGQGLGLSVAQAIVEEHGGDIEVESEVGCGTRFTVWLPPLDLTEAKTVEPTAFVQPEKGRILIADDEDAVRDVCRELLEKLGYEVAEARGGAEALALLAKQRFSLVLVDLQMPDMPGLELVRKINEIPAAQRPAKLIITGNIDDLPAETCAELGISGLLRKRASLNELISKVQLALATKQE